MISVTQAYDTILKQIPHFGVVSVYLYDSLNRVLAQDVLADRDYPPFDRVCMDGFALSSQSWNQGIRSYPIENIVRAGDPSIQLLNTQCAIEVMTGAPTPKGCDIVVRIEDTTVVNGRVIINEMELSSGKNIHPRAKDYQRGDVLLSRGHKIGPPEIAILASVGCEKVLVQKKPRVAIVSTGDELVEVNQTPMDHQIRRSNPYQLQAAWRNHKLGKSDLFHIIDHQEILEDELAKIIAHYDVIILSGGVSMGKYDFIPTTLKKLHVQEHFHKIAQKPGKPMWFGSQLNGPLVFGLPGNPVSAAVCLSRYVIPAFQVTLGKSRGCIQGHLDQSITTLEKLVHFLPVTISFVQGSVVLTPCPTKGSGDFNSLSASDGFIEVPKNGKSLAQGTLVEFYPW